MTRGRHDLKIIRLGLDIKLYFALSRQHAVDRYVMILVIDRLICVFTPEPSKKQHCKTWPKPWGLSTATISNFCLYYILYYKGVSKNKGTPKWMVYNGKPLLKWMIWGYPYFWTHPYTDCRCFAIVSGQSWDPEGSCQVSGCQATTARCRRWLNGEVTGRHPKKVAQQRETLWFHLI